MSDNLRDRLIAARLADSLSLGHNTAAADVAVNRVREWLALDATVERVARAEYCNTYGRPEELRTDWAQTMTGQAFMRRARVGLAALAAALASEGEASDAH